LIRIGKIDVYLTVHQVRAASRIAFIRLVSLNVLLVYLSTEKWRAVDASLRRSSDSVQSRIAAFAVTSTGMALGLVLPVQVGMAAARTLGTYFHGGALKRGGVGTLLEQGFDLLIVVCLAVASGATWLCGGGALMWTLYAAALTSVALLAMGPSIRLIRGLSSRPGNTVLRQSDSAESV
jgi:hypothetical protein